MFLFIYHFCWNNWICLVRCRSDVSFQPAVRLSGSSIKCFLVLVLPIFCETMPLLSSWKSVYNYVNYSPLLDNTCPSNWSNSIQRSFSCFDLPFNCYDSCIIYLESFPITFKKAEMIVCHIYYRNDILICDPFINLIMSETIV